MPLCIVILGFFVCACLGCVIGLVVRTVLKGQNRGGGEDEGGTVQESRKEVR